jgi:four helix bundle protein
VSEVVKSSSRQVVKSLNREFDGVPVFSFEKLELYQRARALSGRLAKLSRLLPAEERFRLKFQMEKARLSLTNAVAEGHGRYTYKDRKHYCYEARGSLQELVDDINECGEMKYAKAEHLGDLKCDAFRVLQMIDGWARYLEKRRAADVKAKRTGKVSTRRLDDLTT